MKSIVSSLVLASLAMAVPMNNKREVNVVEAVVTEWTTTTVYIDPTDAPGAFFEAPAPVPAHPTKSAPAPVGPTIAPSSSSVAVPSPVVQAEKSVVPPPPAAPSAPAAAPASSGPTGNLPSGTGDITYYSVGGTKGSCGTQASDNDAIVALSTAVMGNGGNPNANPLCGKTVNIKYNGNTHTAKVYDTCEGCNANSIDLSPALFKEVAPNGDGRVSGVEWWVSG